MEKVELRPVAWTVYYPADIDEKASTESKRGYFHIWTKMVDSDGSELPFALVEEENGEVTTVEAHKIRFLDRKPEKVLAPIEN